MQNRILLPLLAIVAVLLSSCGGRQARQQGDGDTLLLKYSSLLTIVRHDSYTEVNIRNPWREDKLLHTYLLVPREAHPNNLPHGTVVRTPVRTAAVFTTVHCSLLNTLGHVDDIVAVADLQYIKIPYVHHQVKQGKVIDCGNGMNPVVEKIMDAKPEAILLSPFENAGGYGKLEDIGIPLVECAEYMETSPLARSEWMKFYGLLFGEYQQADSLFNVVEEHYNKLKKLAAENKVSQRSVLVDKMVGSVWYVPGGRSTLGQMITDAGGRYPWSADSHSGSLSLPFETVLEQGGDADVWLYRYSSDHVMDCRELLSEHRGYSQLKAWRQQEVYACNVEKTLFYEETPFRPDLLLSDFIRILYPDTPGLPPLRYYERLK